MRRAGLWTRRVLGPGCANCHKLEEIAKAAGKELGGAAEIMKALIKEEV